MYATGTGSISGAAYTLKDHVVQNVFGYASLPFSFNTMRTAKLVGDGDSDMYLHAVPKVTIDIDGTVKQDFTNVIIDLAEPRPVDSLHRGRRHHPGPRVADAEVIRAVMGVAHGPCQPTRRMDCFRLHSKSMPMSSALDIGLAGQNRMKRAAHLRKLW
jgi:hypothetical protein